MMYFAWPKEVVIALVVGLVLAGTQRAFSDSVALTPVADTTLFETTAGNNLGAEPTLVAGTTANGFRNRALLKFDVATQVPAGASISSAALTLTVSKVNPLSAVSSTFELHRLLQSWGEGTGAGFNTGRGATNGEATWLTRFFPDDLWASPGAGADTDYSAAITSSMFIAGPAAYTFPFSASLVADVQSWLDDPGSNSGWILICQDEATPFTSHRIASREDTANSPTLLVEYTVQQTQPPQIAQLTLANDRINFQFNASAQLTYTIEFNDILGTTNWLTLTNFPAQPAATNITVSDPITAGQRFYRVKSP